MPKKLTSSTRRSSSGCNCSTSLMTVTIAFATYVSMRPKRSSVCSTTWPTSSWTAWSAGTASASDPNASISRTAWSSASPFRAVTTTLAPRSPAPRAIARPSPLEAPVTTTTCSESRFLATIRSSPFALETNGLSWLHARLDRTMGARDSVARRAARVRAEAASRDGTLARPEHAGVQGLHQRQRRGAGRPAAAAAARGDRSARGHARARPNRDLAGASASASSSPRRGGDARRAPRGAASAHRRVTRRAGGRIHRRLLLPRANPGLAEPAAPEGDRQAGHLQPCGAVSHLGQGFAAGRLPARAAGRPLAGLGLPRSGARGAQPARDLRIRRPRNGVARRRHRLRLLRRATRRDPLPDELRQGALRRSAPREGLLLLHDARLVRDGRRVRAADLRARPRAAAHPHGDAAAPRLACWDNRGGRAGRGAPRRRSGDDDHRDGSAAHPVLPRRRARVVPRAALARHARGGGRDRRLSRAPSGCACSLRSARSRSAPRRW